MVEGDGLPPLHNGLDSVFVTGLRGFSYFLGKISFSFKRYYLQIMSDSAALCGGHVNIRHHRGLSESMWGFFGLMLYIEAFAGLGNSPECLVK